MNTQKFFHKYGKDILIVLVFAIFLYIGRGARYGWIELTLATKVIFAASGIVISIYFKSVGFAIFLIGASIIFGVL